ncbi:MAG: MFS transporter [Clostridia bacterium]|nr:MFS transporter [Clostridia bacterium]
MGKSWAVMWSAFLASVAVVYNQFKVSPAMGVLREQLHVDMVTGGWLMSIFAVAGIVLALPAAAILMRLGPKVSGLVAMGSVVLGSAMGATAGSPVTLLVSRGIEGIGLGLIAVVAPAVVAMWFEPHERGLPMGIWAAWVPVGATSALNLGNPIINMVGWRGLWWSGALLAAIAFVVYGLVVTGPPLKEGEKAKATGPEPSLATGLKQPAIWLLALSFAGYSFVAISFGTWAPSYYQERFGLDAGTAGFYAGLMFLVASFVVVIAGKILDLISNRYRMLLISVVLTGLLYCCAFILNSPALIIPFVVGIGFISSFYAPTVFTLAPETMPSPELAGVAMGIMNVGTNVGALLGPPLVGAAVNAAGNWAYGTLPVAGAMAVCVGAAFVFAGLVKPRG